MKNRYKKNINFLIKNKYREANYHYKNFLKDFYSFRNYFKKKIKKKEMLDKDIDQKDTTYIELKNSFEKRSYNDKKIESYYKKFEANFRLKKRYNKNFKVLTNRETSFQSYIYLGLLIIRLKRIDIFQKLNIILKILDKLSVSKKQYRYLNHSLLLKLLLTEEKLIKKIITK